MSSSTTTTVPGMIYPTQKGMISGNPRDSAMQQMTNTNIKQASLSNAVGGKRRSKKGGDGIAIPQYQMQYTPQGGPGTAPNSQIQQNLQTSTQGAANSVYDSNATKMGGKKRGGNPNWNWGCYSGGTKRKKNKKTKRIKRNKKSRKNNRR
jgi:hypothetical protein